jgi:hypothetical protein
LTSLLFYVGCSYPIAGIASTQGGPFLGESTTQNHFSNSGKTGSDLLHASRRFDLKPRGNNAPRGRRFLIDHGSNNDSSNSGRFSLTQAAHSDPRSMHELMTSYPHKGTKAGTQQPVQVAPLSASQSLRRTSLHSSREASAEARERRADFSSHAAAMQGSVTEAEHAKAAILAARERPKADSKAPEMPEKRPHGPNSKGTTKSTAQTMGLRAERKTR